MPCVEIYMSSNSHPLGQLPVEECLETLESKAREHPRLVGELRALIQHIKQLALSGKQVLKLAPSESNRSERLHLQHMTSSLIYQNIGALHCPQCAEMIDAERIIYEEFKRGKASEKSSTGKRFYCPKNHLLFEHLDLRF